jgi:uncharacterized protein (TIGR02145 family)
MFSPSNSFCYNGNVYPKCSGMEYNPTTHICQGYAVSPATCGGRQYNPLEQRCGSNGYVETKCGAGSSYHNPETQFCNGSEVLSKCNGEEYNPLYQRCRSNAVETKCGTGNNYYNPETQFCNGNAVLSKCNGDEYNPEYQRCRNYVVETKCGTGSNYYNSETQFCNGNSVLSKCSGSTYNPENQRCYNNTVETKCGTNWYNYNLSAQFCSGNNIYNKCGGKEYNPSNQRCENNIVETKCGTGSSYYNHETQFCSGNGVYYLCNGWGYDPASQRCGTNNVIETECGGNWYVPNPNQRCQNNVVEIRCGTGSNFHNPATQFCVENSVYNRCSGNEYNPSTHYCKNGTTLMQYDGSVTYAGQTYKTVVIGTQTWMAENLNYNAAGSKCYFINSESNCGIYGRLYDWATAMALPSSCNSTSCPEIGAKHQGVCPSGWHIPKAWEWETLLVYVKSDNMWCSNCEGKYLKSTSGWNSYSGIVNLDSYGFSALPGGFGYSGGGFGDVGYHGHWWSDSESGGSDAYRRNMSYSFEYAYWSSSDKSYLFSVRCLKD